MVRNLSWAAFAVFLSSSVVFAAAPQCGPGKQCPSDAPCCSAYGQCGVGAYCLGGCDPKFSHQLDSCVPAPTCQSNDFKFADLNDVQSIDKYLGDASNINWVSQGQPSIYDNSLLLTMAEGTVGTLLASAHYVWYGKISAKLTTSQGKGVVTAFIMMSDVKDEIDFEFIGVDTQNAQSNYYSQGVTVYTNEKNLTAQDTVGTVHEYTIDWQPDQLTWSIDGKVLRTVKRSDTWNATSNRFDYPQTPARIELSLWPAGLSTNDPGTINWAGGEIDWNSQYMQNGYYYARVHEVNVQCYDPPSGAQVKGKKTYKYDDISATNNTIEITDDSVILASLQATGENPDLGKSSSGAPAPTNSAESVPGQSGGGNRGEQQSSAVGSATGTGAASASQTGSNSFQQGNGNGGQSGALALKARDQSLKTMGGSALAVVLAVTALMIL